MWTKHYTLLEGIKKTISTDHNTTDGFLPCKISELNCQKNFTTFYICVDSTCSVGTYALKWGRKLLCKAETYESVKYVPCNNRKCIKDSQLPYLWF